MKIENYKKAGKFRIFFPILLVFAIPLIGFGLFGNESYSYIYTILGVVALLIYGVFIFRKPNYFYFETNQNFIIIRFYNPHPGFTKPKAFQIPINSFSDYKIKQELGGFRKFIFFQIKKRKQKGWYPAVSISLLKKDEIEKLKNELESIKKMKSFK